MLPPVLNYLLQTVPPVKFSGGAGQSIRFREDPFFRPVLLPGFFQEFLPLRRDALFVLAELVLFGELFNEVHVAGDDFPVLAMDFMHVQLIELFDHIVDQFPELGAVIVGVFFYVGLNFL